MKTILMLFLMLSLCAVKAAPAAPTVGLWEDVVVINDDTLQLISHQHFIFTDQALQSPTIFTALKDFGGEIDVYCCLSVENITPIPVERIEKRFSHDHDFVQRFSHIHGLNYMYEAKLADKHLWNERMRLLKGDKNDMNDIPFSAPVIAGKLTFSDTPGHHFKTMDGQDIEFSTHVPNDGSGRQPLTHHFTIGHKKVSFTVPIPSD